MRYIVTTNQKASAPKLVEVVANSPKAATVAVEQRWEGVKVLKVELTRST